ncbi:hypothetical protein [Gimesia chilikensis]|uniref:hypothetical protein n=1 Tax=Gimesia chilikensis TaxID=2605989 RepID=UPI0011A81366|nr:hypothetical protein [Gimesia chilikensis]
MAARLGTYKLLPLPMVPEKTSGVGSNAIRAERSEQEVAAHSIILKQSFRSALNSLTQGPAPSSAHTSTSCCLRQYQIVSNTTLRLIDALSTFRFDRDKISGKDTDAQFIIATAF